MAKNLRAKLPKEDTLYIQDVNTAATEKFMSTGLNDNTKVASNPREVAENAVCLSPFSSRTHVLMLNFTHKI
jgi:hypothetical protein